MLVFRYFARKNSKCKKTGVAKLVQKRSLLLIFNRFCQENRLKFPEKSLKIADEVSTTFAICKCINEKRTKDNVEES